MSMSTGGAEQEPSPLLQGRLQVSIAADVLRYKNQQAHAGLSAGLEAQTSLAEQGVDAPLEIYSGDTEYTERLEDDLLSGLVKIAQNEEASPERRLYARFLLEELTGEKLPDSEDREISPLTSLDFYLLKVQEYAGNIGLAARSIDLPEDALNFTIGALEHRETEEPSAYRSSYSGRVISSEITWAITESFGKDPIDTYESEEYLKAMAIWEPILEQIREIREISGLWNYLNQGINPSSLGMMKDVNRKFNEVSPLFEKARRRLKDLSGIPNPIAEETS